MYELEFKQINNAIKNDSLTFFVGAGISKLSNAPSWKELIDSICIQMGMDVKDEYSSDEFLRIPQIYYNYINKDDASYYSFLEEKISSHTLKTNEVHKLIYSFKPSSIITTNYDNLLEKAALEKCMTYKCVACDSEIAGINGNRFILKVHGDFEHHNVVLKEEDYLNYSNNFTLTETIIKSIFSTNTVVFIGYSLNDYNIKLILNWTKSLLKDSFKSPIFITTDNEELSDSELLYHKSRGLSVVEYKRIINNNEPDKCYLNRYKKVLEAIKSSSNLSLAEKDKFQLFDVLYELLKPLHDMKAIRISDINEKLLPYVVAFEEGKLVKHSDKYNLLGYFVEVNQLSEEEKANMPQDINQKYSTIIQILSKAGIAVVKIDEDNIVLNDILYHFADEFCLSLDYLKMRKFAEKNHTSFWGNYKKAFYLARLKKYKEAYDLLMVISKKSYERKEFLHYYLAQININQVVSAINSLNNSIWYYQQFDMNQFNKNRNVFKEMPVEFQIENGNFEDLSKVTLFYKTFYDSYLEAQKLKNSIESLSLEGGITSLDTVAYRIKNTLHFLLENHLCFDEFSEFKNTIQSLMRQMVYKYSIQNKLDIQYQQVFKHFAKEKVHFDSIDFYCFVEYFDEKTIKSMFAEYEIDTIVFDDSEDIEKAILNLIKYCEYLKTHDVSFLERMAFFNKFKTCLSLMKYMDLSQSIVDKTIKFIFKYNFNEILIDDKLTFVIRQLYHRNKYSKTTEQVLKHTLFDYLDRHIHAIKRGEEFDSPSSSSHNYPELVYYIYKNEKAIRGLSHRVETILDNQYEELYSAVMNQYFDYLPKRLKRDVITLVQNQLRISFKLKPFLLLLSEYIKPDKAIMSTLYNCLDKSVAREDNSAIVTYPAHEKYDDLREIAFKCLEGKLDKQDFEKYIGLDDRSDFYFEYEDFDYNRFDVSWLIYLKDSALEILSKSEIVKTKIRGCLVKELCKNAIVPKDKKILTNILINHFS